MYRKVIRDYIYHFKDAIKRIHWSDWFAFIYIGMIATPTFSKRTDMALSFYSIWIPLMIALLLSRMYGGIIPKAFFLCPLSSTQRQKYARAGIIIRTSLSPILFTIFNSIALICEAFPLYMSAIRFLVFIPTVTAYNIYCQPLKSDTEVRLRKFNLKGNFEFWSREVLVTSVLTIFFICCIEYNERLWEIVLIGILILINTVSCLKTIITFYPQVINHIRTVT